MIMAETLYRKYRPQRFTDVAEQQHVVRTITHQIADGTVAHAYIFAGPRGVGKTTVACLPRRSTAKAVSQPIPSRAIRAQRVPT